MNDISGRPNIIKKSNVYINTTKGHYDKNVIAQVHHYSSLRKLETWRGTSSSWNFSPAQREILQQAGGSCLYDRPNISWGVDIATKQFACKCERTDCNNYAHCSSLPHFIAIKRSPQNEEAISEYSLMDYGLARYFEGDEQEQYNAIFVRDDEPTHEVSDEQAHENLDEEPGLEVVSTEEPPVETTPVAAPKAAKLIPPTKSAARMKYTKIESPDEVITQAMQARIVVNAGPGTGKTYTVIQRLLYILRNELADPGKMLVLCYSRAAVKVIRNRIEAEIAAGQVPDNSRLLLEQIRTFDSFVTYMLSDGEDASDLTRLDYDERIRLFTKQLLKNKEAFSELAYLVVDEFQDTVGARAEMVRALLQSIRCGFLLLGDQCQAIYDYLITDDKELNSYRFYRWIETECSDAKGYELTRNMRQGEELCQLSAQLRDAILSDDTSRQQCAVTACIEQLKGAGKTIALRSATEKQLLGATILCRKNAVAAMICGELHLSEIAVTLNRGARHTSLAPWIGILLSDITDARIGRAAFLSSVASHGIDEAEEKWWTLKCVADDGADNVLDIRLLARRLSQGGVFPDALYDNNEGCVQISTVHRAKGREFDRVVLFSGDYEDWGESIDCDAIRDEAKIAYVAMTRAKRKIEFCSGNTFTKYARNLPSGRQIGTGRSPKGPFCNNILIREDDIDPQSFVGENGVDVQSYLRGVRVGDEATIGLLSGRYFVFHNGKRIAAMKAEFTWDVRAAMDATNRSRNLPSELSKVYVDKIVTLVGATQSDTIAQPYRTSGFWLGVELVGFAKTAW